MTRRRPVPRTALACAGSVLLFLAQPSVAQDAGSAGGPAADAPPAAAPSTPGPDASTDGSKDQGTQAPHHHPRPAQRLERVEVHGSSDTEKRRQSTAAMIVVGHEEIERYGDSTLDEVLKRLPSVTIGGRARRGGSISLRGMGNGYTQILINGERIPPGLAIDQIIPEQVERIEIYRAPTAETGARAIAGTINIVLRDAPARFENEIRPQFGMDADHPQESFSWIRNDRIDERGSYNFTVSAASADLVTQSRAQSVFSDIATGAPELIQDRNTTQHDQRDNVHVTARIQWHPDAADQVSIQPFMNFAHTRSRTDGTLEQPLGSVPAPYATTTSTSDSTIALARVQAEWNHTLNASMRLESHASVGGFQSSSSSLTDDLAGDGASTLVQTATARVQDHSWTWTEKFHDQWSETQEFLAGSELEGVERDESATTTQNGVNVLTGLGSNFDAEVLRSALYAQDEWDPDPRWATNVGVRWEGIDTTSTSGDTRITNDSSVFTPLAHAVWRFDAPERDQVRWSLTRSYRAPTLQNLVGLPVLSPLYPVDGPNVASSPDQAGNPDLKPETALGFDTALEHYLPRDGVMSVSFFARHIQNLIRTVTELEDVPWSPDPRWVARPRNVGAASTRGIEADAKFDVQTLWATAPDVTLRGNVSVYRSDVEGVFGPNNRIDQQPNLQSNLGFDYRLGHPAWTVGANVSYTPPYTIQSTDTQASFLGVRRIVDAYALWTVSPTAKVRFSISNLSPHQYLTAVSTVQGPQLQVVTTEGPTTTLFAVRLELRI